MLLNDRTPIENLYAAYGLSVSGVKATYQWTFDGSNRKEDCLTHICIRKNGREIYNKELGNNVIFLSTFERHIDYILWFLSKERVDAYDLEKIVKETLIDNKSLFSYRIEQRMRKEMNNYKVEETRFGTKTSHPSYGTLTFRRRTGGSNPIR